VFRHADRTPKQKLKYNFPVAESWTQPFVGILSGEREEIILREHEQLQRIVDAVEEAKSLGATGEDLGKLEQLSTALSNKIDLPGTKAQLKPAYKRVQGMNARQLVKLQLVFKWGGEVRASCDCVTSTYACAPVYPRGSLSISRPGRKHEKGYLYYESVLLHLLVTPFFLIITPDKDVLHNVKVCMS
jgi:hypothetical protein